ncbi:PadR family transcriptional regulator [Alkalibaculum sp. M08DMB]|uniref:PadR family transcriptional regulator n=1 Tax=Alkalibaculum sporogenes TaxID=2655001 RepID=A0A6A7K5A0_9FIRM|nr:PadR family transcriptional regulator [Alkalibaculum sporogenes]MPW24514.1 PadR family transcriptional regulator [Alkalibaculum sporogenes]
MAREQFQNLTEPMYYILLALTRECCGVDIMDMVSQISHGRVKVGPGTLYTLLAKFELAKIIKQTKVEGRKRSYIITEKGMELLRDEYERLLTLATEGKTFLED